MEKRGQGLSTSAIILIVLGVFVLVLLILGFMMGWDTMAPWLSSENVDKIAQSCSVACSAGNTYNFCSSDKELIDKAKIKTTSTCEKFSDKEKYPDYNVKPCPSIPCPGSCSDLGGSWMINDCVPNVHEDLTLKASDSSGSKSCCKEIPFCGNGKVDTGEECDDGNKDDKDACSNLCKK